MRGVGTSVTLPLVLEACYERTDKDKFFMVLFAGRVNEQQFETFKLQFAARFGTQHGYKLELTGDKFAILVRTQSGTTMSPEVQYDMRTFADRLSST